MEKVRERKIFKKIYSNFHVENLLELQLNSFKDFLQLDKAPDQRELKGLEAVFRDYFPITDAKETKVLEYEGYELGTPKYTIQECKARGLTYGAPLKIKFSLYSKIKGEELKKITNYVYLGDLPLMTETGSFIINGAERVIIPQIHRSPGIFFAESFNNNKKIITARIIPYRGSWVEFFIDPNGVFLNLGGNRKLPITVLLKALKKDLNFSDILEKFIEKKEAFLNDDNISELVGKFLAEDIVDKSTGEVIAEKLTQITESVIDLLEKNNVTQIYYYDVHEKSSKYLLLRTFLGDKCETRAQALKKIYNLLRTGEPPSEAAAESIMDRIFFSVRRYDLGEIGRYRINKRLYDTEEGSDSRILEIRDIYRITEMLLEYYDEDVELDDIDHLSNRRVRPVGELLEHKFAAAMLRLTRLIKDKMATSKEITNINELVNARAVYSVIMNFFQTSQLSQFMDQTNPLSELTNKRRVSSLGPGGLTRERAGFEVRDVHYTHYGKLCPIETPEGPNIGLILSLANFAKINKYGFLMTPYYKVENGVVTDKIDYLLAEDEEKYVIAPADTPRDENNRLLVPADKGYITCRKKGDFVNVKPEEVDYIDVSTIQMVSVSASLIPFLEHDDANRALMGSNMQRQAVPLLFTEAPIVGTGMEEKAARDSGAVVVSDVNGEVIKVDANKIVIRPDLDTENFIIYEDFVYNLRKFERSNQNTLINQRPLVKVGDKVKKGDIIADGMATDRGELALGKNVLVAFMCWNGYNFEDAIIMSEELLKKDYYTSVHIEEFEVEVRDTKRGPEELTRELPNFTEEALKDLDEDGVIRVGARVKPGDVLVGKVTPKGETDLSPEEKLLRAIFGERAGDVRDTSLKAEPGMNGVVVETRLYSRKKQTNKTKEEDQRAINEIERIIAENNKNIIKQRTLYLKKILTGKKSKLLLDKYTKDVVVSDGKVFDDKLIESIKFENLDLSNGITYDAEANEKALKVIEQSIQKLKENEARLEYEIEKIMRGDELKPDVLKLVKVYLATKRKLSVGDKFAGRHGNKGVVSTIVPEADMPFMDDGTPVQVVLNPLGIPSRMNIGQLLETHLGWAAYKQGYYVKVPVFNSASVEQIKEELQKAGLSPDGKVKLRDGRTGEYFDTETTVGIMYMMKLNHLVEDKVHARSIGPYSLITQQPLGGKSQFGGQRFGEMEVWAIEAYGAAYLLQELLTVKSDDVVGRVKVYEAIVKGENLPEFGIPESFKVLINEIRALGIDIYVE